MLDDKLKVYKYGGLIMIGATVKINEIGKAGEWISTMAKVKINSDFQTVRRA